MASDTANTTDQPGVIKVAIIEDQRDIREGLAWIIRATEGFHCAGAFRSMEEALEKISYDMPDVVLTDIGLPGMSGIEGIRILKDRYPKLLLLMITVYEDDEMIFDALCAGACGYLLKKTLPARLIESLRDAMQGDAPMSPEVASRDRMTTIASASRELLDSMSDIVWAINPQKEHLKDLIQRMRRFASDLLTGRNIAFHFKAPEGEQDLKLSADTRR